MGSVTVVGATATVLNTMGAAVTGAATIHAAISDGSDSTYASVNNTTTGELGLKIPTPTIPAGAVVTGISFKLRRSVTTGVGQPNPFWLFRAFGFGYDFFGVPGEQHGVEPGVSGTASLAFTTAIQDSETLMLTGFSDGFHVKDMDPASLTVYLGFYATGLGTSPSIRLYRLETTFWFNEKPVVTVTAPSDPATSSKPLVQWTFSDAEGEPQRSWRRIIVEAGTPSTTWPFGYPGDTGYDPMGAEGSWIDDSGLQYLPVNEDRVFRGLEDGHTYYAYVQASTDPVAGVYQDSLWAWTSFTVDTAGPADPNFAVTQNNTTAKIHIEISESTTAAPHPVRYDLERSQDGGESWQYVRNGAYAGLGAGTYLDGTVGNGWDTPDSPRFTFANGLRARWHGNLVDYTPSAWQVLCGQSASVGWYLRLLTNGTLDLQWSSNGTTYANSATSTVANGVTNGTDIWFEVELIAGTNPCTVVFRKSTDGVAWTQLGAPVTASGPRLVVNSTQALEMGGYAGRSADVPIGTTYDLNVWNSDNQLVASPSWVGLDPRNVAYHDSTGNLWTRHGTANHLRVALIVDDYEAALGLETQYAARAYSDDGVDVASGNWVYSTVTTLTPAKWLLKDPYHPELNQPLDMVSIERTKPKSMAVVDGLEARTAFVVHGGHRSDRMNATIRTLNRAQHDAVVSLLTSGRTLLLQSVLGEQWYVQPGDIQFELIHAAPSIGETFPIRHAYELSVVLIEVLAP